MDDGKSYAANRSPLQRILLLLVGALAFGLLLLIALGVGNVTLYLSNIGVLPDWMTTYVVIPISVFAILFGLPMSVAWLAEFISRLRSRQHDSASRGWEDGQGTMRSKE